MFHIFTIGALWLNILLASKSFWHSLRAHPAAKYKHANIQKLQFAVKSKGCNYSKGWEPKQYWWQWTVVPQQLARILRHVSWGWLEVSGSLVPMTDGNKEESISSLKKKRKHLWSFTGWGVFLHKLDTGDWNVEKLHSFCYQKSRDPHYCDLHTELKF